MKKKFLLKFKTCREMKHSLFSCFAFLLLLLSVESGSKEFVKIFLPNGVCITAELAVTDEERQLGLMYREKIASDQGMLFVFEEEGRHSFWMKNMKFSLDLIWLNREKRIVHIELRVPPCKDTPCPTYSSEIPAMYVLELKAGSADENKLKLYDRLEFILPAKFP
jgi:hypothetical protein